MILEFLSTSQSNLLDFTGILMASAGVLTIFFALYLRERAKTSAEPGLQKMISVLPILGAGLATLGFSFNASQAAEASLINGRCFFAWCIVALAAEELSRFAWRATRHPAPYTDGPKA